MNVISSLNNREIATIIWLSIGFIWSLTKPTIRNAFLNVLKAFFVKKIILPTICMFIYITLMVLVFNRIGFWDISALQDTILWIFGVAFVMLINSIKAANDEHYFRKIILDTIKLIIVFEFIVNLYSFNLVVELILLPIVSLVVIMSSFTEVKPEYKKIKVILDYILGLFGVVLVGFTFYRIFIDFQSFASLKNLRDFSLPIFFTIAFIPYIYLLALFIKYEDIFTRIDIVNTDTKLARYAKQKIFRAFHFNLGKLIRFSKDAKFLRFNDKDAVSSLIRKFKDE